MVLLSILDATLNEWNIKGFAYVHNTASNLNKSLCLAKSVTDDFGCLAHILQNGINDSFADSDGKVIEFVGKLKKLK